MSKVEEPNSPVSPNNVIWRSFPETDNAEAGAKLNFSRFEFKYLLTDDQRREVEESLRHFVEFDAFVRELPKNQYFVRSLYFDDPQYSAFHEKIDGLHSRWKFRVRTYTKQQGDQSDCYLEQKGRHNNLVFKHRCLIGGAMADLAGQRGEKLGRYLIENVPAGVVRNQFEYEIFRKRIAPIALIDYRRRPYYSRFDPGFRLTFDEDISVTRADSIFDGSLGCERKVLAGYTVLEIKFQHHLPAWFHSIIQAHEMCRLPISKICEGMQVLGMAHDES